MKPLRWLSVSLSLATAEAPTALSHRVYPCVMGPQTSMPVKVRKYVSVYIIWLSQTPQACQCTWRLMTNQRPGGAGPAAPPPPAMTSPPATGPPEAGRGSRGSLATCDVLPADRRSNQKETVT